MLLKYGLGITYLKDRYGQKWFLNKDVASCLGITAHGLKQKRAVKTQVFYCQELKRNCGFLNEESLLYLFQDPALEQYLKTGESNISVYEIVIRIGLICRAISFGPNYKIKKAKNWAPENTATGGLDLVYDEVSAPYGIIEGVELLPKELSLDLAKEISNNFIQFQFLYIGDLLPLREKIQKAASWDPTTQGFWSKDFIRSCYQNKGFSEKANNLIINQWQVEHRDTYLLKALQSIPLSGPALKLANRSAGWPDLLDAPTAGF